MVFTLTVPDGFSLDDISNVGFNYGTALNPAVPIPPSALLLGSGLLGLGLMGGGLPEEDNRDKFPIKRTGKTMSYRIVIADDHQIVRQGLRTLLEKEADMQVVGEAEDGRQALSMVREFIPHVVIMDVKMSNMNGIEATRQIHSELPQVKVIALSMYSDGSYVTNMLRAGASGYLLKDGAFEELAQAIRLVTSNRSYLSPGVANVVVKDYLSNLPVSPTASAFSILSTREREVLQLLSEGKRSYQIAKHLHISIKTVDAHRQTIMQKLNLRSVAELTKYAIREGLTPLEG